MALEKPLSSEQMLASIRQALGDGKPLAIDLADKSWTEWQAQFDKALANPAREPEVEHSPTVKAALFLMNDTTRARLAQAGGREPGGPAARSETDAGKLADELYVVRAVAPAERRGEAGGRRIPGAAGRSPRAGGQQPGLEPAGLERVLCESLN